MAERIIYLHDRFKVVCDNEDVVQIIDEYSEESVTIDMDGRQIWIKKDDETKWFVGWQVRNETFER